MSNYQDGYDKGYQDAINGEREMATDTFLSIFDELIDGDDRQKEWEEGYTDGYEAGEEELEEKEEEEEEEEEEED